MYIHGHTRIFARGLFADLGISLCPNLAISTALCALRENESSISLCFQHTHVRFVSEM